MYKRFPKNVDGDFYTTGTLHDDNEWYGDCLTCDIPESEAPDLLATLTDSNSDTYFIRQPANEKELEQAISATKVCCVNAIRYSGKDKSILEKLHPDVSDYILSKDGEVILNTLDSTTKPYSKKWWKFWT